MHYLDLQYASHQMTERGSDLRPWRRRMWLRPSPLRDPGRQPSGIGWSSRLVWRAARGLRRFLNLEKSKAEAVRTLPRTGHRLAGTRTRLFWRSYSAAERNTYAAAVRSSTGTTRFGGHKLQNATGGRYCI
jgi:hypothetical protein